jgi:hypothetical protein
MLGLQAGKINESDGVGGGSAGLLLKIPITRAP